MRILRAHPERVMTLARRGHRVRRLLGLLAATVVVSGAVLLGAPALAEAKSFSMGPVRIGAEVGADGSMDVVERRTFTFNGSYTFVLWQLDTGGAERLEVLGVEGPEGPYALATSPTAYAEGERPPAHYLVNESTGMTEVYAFFRAADEARDITLRYRVHGAATRWEDTAELYWQFVGDRSELGTTDVAIGVKLPSGGEPVVPEENVRAWTHGPLTGRLSFSGDPAAPAAPVDGDVIMTLDRLPANTFVEARIAFPAEWLSEVRPSGGDRLERIIADETRSAEEANRARTLARFAVAISWAGAIGLSLVALGVSTFLFVRWGREHAPSFQGKYYREVPGSLHPALVGSIWRMGKTGDAEVAATVMSLINRGVIAVRSIQVEQDRFIGTKTVDTLEMRLDRSRYNDLEPLDRDLVRFWFQTVADGADTLTLEDLKAFAKSKPQTFADRMKAWQDLVRAEAQTREYFEKSGAAGQVIVVLLGVLSGIATIALAIWSGVFVLIALAVPVTAVCLVLATVMPRRSPGANDLHAKYRALRNYLRDFSRLHEAPPMHVKLWEEFLVMATVFGISKQVIEQMTTRIPEVVRDPAFVAAYGWAYSSSSGGSPANFSDFVGGFSSASSIASSQLSSSSGGGGGFSGGGGGGGGGGGVSAG